MMCGHIYKEKKGIFENNEKIKLDPRYFELVCTKIFYFNWWMKWHYAFCLILKKYN